MMVVYIKWTQLNLLAISATGKILCIFKFVSAKTISVKEHGKKVMDR